VRIAAIAALAYFKINVSSIVDKLLLILRNSSLDLGHSEEEYSWRILIVVAMALERLGFKQVVINELLMTLKNGDSRACYGAAVVLGELGVNNPEIVDALENALVNAIAINDSDILKAEILEVMQKLNVDKLIIFHSWLLSIKDRVKGGDIDYILERIIWEKDDEKMAGNLLKALEHEDVFVRLIALIAIGRLGVSTPNVVDALLIALKNEDLTLRGGAIQAISELNISEKKIVDELFIILETDNRQEVRGNVAILLSEFGLGKNPKVIAGLLEALRIESEMILHNAAGVSVQTGDPSTLIAMSSELWDENTYLQGKAANYLINLGLDEPVIKDGLFEMLNEETWPVKLSAVAVLGRIGIDSIDTLNVMFGLLEKEEFPVTWGIVVALGQSRVFTPELAKTLLVTIEDSKEEMRIKSALAIRHLCVGRASSSIPADWRNILVSALQKALESPANHETVYSKAESVHWPIYNVIWQALWDVTSDS
jgi:HEAT repeat protein